MKHLDKHKAHLIRESSGHMEQVPGEIILQLEKHEQREDGLQRPVFWVPVVFDLGQGSYVLFDPRFSVEWGSNVKLKGLERDQMRKSILESPAGCPAPGTFLGN